jgi:myo-inositol catabolism protein IolH
VNLLGVGDGAPTYGIGKGEIKWDVLFSKLREINFDGIATVAVFGEKDRADESSRFKLERVTQELGQLVR